MFKSFEDVQNLSKENLEACTASAAALTKGMQSIAAESVDFSRKSFEKSSELMEKVVASKSFDKAIEVQTGFAKEAYEAYMSQMTKMGELFAATAKDAFKPFEASMAKVAPKASAAK
jgi:phasin family protein